jgi:hypothetical protein
MSTPPRVNARCPQPRCGRVLYRRTMEVPDPTHDQQVMAAQPHRGCGGRVVPLREVAR